MIFYCELCGIESKAKDLQVGTYPIALMCVDSEACIDRMAENQKEKLASETPEN